MADAGWYPDPSGRHQHRWWTGQAWAAAVADAGVSSFDVDGLTPGAPRRPKAEPSPADHAAVVQACGVPALPGDDPLTAPVLVLWHRRAGLLDVVPTWSVHDGIGTWLGTFGLEVSGVTPNDRAYVLHQPHGGSVTVVPDRPAAVARLRDAGGAEVAAIVTDGSTQRVAAVIDGMTLAHATFAIGEVAIVGATGDVVGRLVPPPLGLRRDVGRRVGWDPVLVAEQVAVADPFTGRAINALALAWEHTLREWVA